MGDIKFKFKLEELIRAIVFFAQNGISDFTKLKSQSCFATIYD